MDNQKDNTNISKKENIWLEKLGAETLAQIADPEFSVMKLAETMSLSHSQLFRRLKHLLGVNPSQYIREIRLQAAKELLEKGLETSVTATAKQVGLKDVAHFSRLFKGRFGQSPSELF